MRYTFDSSETLGLALVANDDLSQAAYVLLKEAPDREKIVPLPYLRQLHAVANAVAYGPIVLARIPFDAQAWSRLPAAK